MDATAFEARTEPEKIAGGFGRHDGTVAFYQRIDALISPEMIVLDLGAGRGAQLETQGYPNRLARLQGRVRTLVGVDVDPAVERNPYMDEVKVIDAKAPLPFDAETFDLIYSDWVLEHVEDPKALVGEIFRVLKPGGWFCARTPSKWSYIAVMARLIPESAQSRALKSVQPERREEDVFPKLYRMNSMPAIRHQFLEYQFVNASYTHNPSPSYHGHRLWLYRAIEFYQAIPIRALHTTIHVFVQKRATTH